MEDEKEGTSTFKTEHSQDLNPEMAKRSIIVSNLPAEATMKQITIHFQRSENNGGDIEKVAMLNEGKAIVVFYETEVAENVLKKEQLFNGVTLQLKPWIMENTNDIVEEEVFSLVSAKINPDLFNLTPDKMHELLTDIASDTNIRFIELCDGFWVSGTYSQIQKTCLKLSSFATPKEAQTTQPSNEEQNGMNVEEQECKPFPVDVHPELMYILRNEIKEIENKYNIKVDHQENSNAAILRPLGDVESFNQGTDEFIGLYQKNYPSMDKKTFELITSEATFKQLSEELMGSLDVVIQRKQNQVSIYGRAEDVSEATQRLQGKQRRGRRPVGSDSAMDVLPKPDTAQAQLPTVLRHTLDNGITVSVYQGDLTKQQVDAIVNAANEQLEHGGGLAGSVVKQGGFQIQQESWGLVNRFGPVPVGQVVFTGSGSLPCRKVLHAVGPRWREQGPERSRELIHLACLNSLLKASQFSYRSIAIPAISSGIFGVPVEICAEMLFTAVEMFSCEVTSNNQLKDIRFVNIDSPTNEAIRREFCKRYGYKYVSANQTDRGPDRVYTNTSWTEKKNDELKNNESQAPAMTYAGAAASTAGDRLQRQNGNLPSSAVPEEGKLAKTAAGMAAIKREEKAKLHQGASPLSDVGPSFSDGFKKRQAETERRSENKIDKKASQAASDKESKAEESSNMDTKEKNNKDDKKDSAGTDRETGSADQTDNTNQDMMKDSSKDDKTIHSKSDVDAGEPRGVTGKGDANEMKGAGRGRGALKKLASTFPGIAMRVNGSSEKQSEDDQKSNQQETSPNNEVQYPLEQTESASVEDTITNVQQPQEFPATQQHLEKQRSQTPPAQQSSEDTGIKSVQPSGQQPSDPSPSHPSSSPPGLSITNEGLNLAADHEPNAGLAENLGKLPTSQNNGQDKNNKRKLTDHEGSLDKSSKQRKEESATVNNSNREKTESQNNTLPKQGAKDVTGDEGAKDAGKDDISSTENKQKEESKLGDSDDPNKENQEGDNAGSESVMAQRNNEEKTSTHPDDKSVFPENPDQDKDVQLLQEIFTKTHISNQSQAADNNQQVGNVQCDSKVDGEIHDIHPVANEIACSTEQKDQEKLASTTQPGELGLASTSADATNDKVKKEEFELTEKTTNDESEHKGNKGNTQDTETSTTAKDNERQNSTEHHSDDHDQAGNTKNSKGTDLSLISSYEVVEQPKSEDNDIISKRDQRVSEGSSSSIEIIDLLHSEDDHELNDNTEVYRTAMDTDSKDSNASCNDNQNNAGVVSIVEGEPISDIHSKVDVDTESKDVTDSEGVKTDYTEDPSKNDDKKATDGDQRDKEGQSEICKSNNDATTVTSQPGTLDGNDTTATADKVAKAGKELPSDDKKGEETVQKGNGEKKVASCEDQLAEAMGSLSLGSDEGQTKPTPPHQDDCCLCNTPFSSGKSKVILSGCGHIICQDCQTRYQHSKPFICSICKKAAGCNDLQPIGGRMKFSKIETRLDGFESYETIAIDYEFPSGIQGSCHPHPGQSYSCLNIKRTFLPNTPKGQEVREMLKKAFETGALFTIKNNQIVFTGGVEHKTNIKGGPTAYGYPDADYLDRVTKQLHDILQPTTAP